MKVVIDRENCIGCGLCASTCPEIFAMADDGKAEVVSDKITNEAGAVEAADACPVNVIDVL